VLVALGAAVCLALLGTGVIARRMTRSLGLLSSATAEVAAGAFREPLAAEGADEIGALARSFNRMTRQLGRQFSALSMRSEISVTLNQHQKLEEILQKCAEILAQHLDLALAGVCEFPDLDRLTIFADNLVPHVLRVDGVLTYDPDLGARIDREELLPPGDEEREIRACAVHAGELGVEALEQLRRDLRQALPAEGVLEVVAPQPFVAARGVR